MQNLNIKLKVVVSPDVEILNKLANDLDKRLSLHADHAAMYANTGLTADEMKRYFFSALWRKARAIRLTTEGNKIPDKHLLNRLYFPAGLTRHIVSIGNVQTAEYSIEVIEETIAPVKDGEEPVGKQVYLMTDDEMREASQKFFQLSSFLPVFNKQFKFEDQGGEAMFGIVDAEFMKPIPDNVAVRTFTNKTFDEKYLEITAVLGLKLHSTNSALLYPSMSLIDEDVIRSQFATGEGFRKEVGNQA